MLVSFVEFCVVRYVSFFFFFCLWSRFEWYYINPISASKYVSLYGLKLNSTNK